METSPGHNLIQFNLSDLEKATKGFKSSYKIGEGDFGAFYRGTIKLSGKSTPVLIQQIQGHVLKVKSDHSWVKELNTIAAMKHQNLLNLVGYCLSGGVRFVVGEYLEKATKGFKSSYKIGEGDFGAFYRGTIKLSGKSTPVLIQQIQGHVLKVKIVLRSFKSSSIVIDENLKG
nr:serine/threonine-protein kinase PCRK1-like [Quercus suber]